jgi:hypothetical protein
MKSFMTLAPLETGFNNLSHGNQKKLHGLAQLTLSKKVFDKMSFV